MKKTLVLLIIFCFTTLPLGGCAPENTLFLGSRLTLSLYGGDVRRAEREIREFLSDYEKEVSARLEGSTLNRLNAADGGEAVAFGAHAANTLRAALSLKELSGGAFDPFLLPLTRLWGFDGDAEMRVPGSGDIAAALDIVKNSALTVSDDGSFVKHGAGTGIDLGAVAKGYAAETAADIAKKHGASGIIDIAGNVAAVGRYTRNGEDRPYRIAVTDPRAAEHDNRYFGTLHIEDATVSVSGDYERYFTEDGVRYCHIIDSRTGAPVQNDVISVVIADPSGTRADALSTAVMVLGGDAGLRFMQEQGLSGIVIFSDMTYTVCGGVTLADVYGGYSVRTQA